MREFITEIEERYPLLRDLYLATSSSASEEHFPTLVNLLLSIAENVDEGRSCCFVLPEIATVAPLISVSMALISLRRDFDSFTQYYAKRSLKRGQRVRILPTGHVYVYDGVFPDMPHLFRLKVMGTNDARSLRVDQILRLEPTTRKRPKGKLISDLGEPAQSNLDRLLDLQSCGNESLYRNRVIFLSTRSHFEEFLKSVYITRERNRSGARNRLGDILPWGSLDEQGRFVSSDPYHVTGEPLLAVTHSLEYLAKACQRLREESRHQPIIIVEGTQRLVRHYHAFDEVADYNRLLIIADESNQQDLVHLEDRGCLIWRASDDEILLGNKKTSILFDRVFRATKNRARLQIEALGCSNEHLELAATGLILASDHISGLDGLEETERCLRQLFGLLFRVSECISPFSDQVRSATLQQLHGAKAKLERQAMWVPRGAMELLLEVCTYLEEAILDPSQGRTKGDALLHYLDGQTFSASEVLLLTRYQQSCGRVKDWCREKGLDVQVSSDRLIPKDYQYEQIILLSWLNTSRFQRLLKRYAAPNITLLAYPFEASWLEQFRVRLRRESIQGRPDDKERAMLLGIEEATLRNGTTTEEGPNDEPDEGDLLPTGLSLFGIEEKIIKRRKGRVVRDLEGADVTEAYYVGFLGDTYSYVTPGHHLPVITSLIQDPESSLSKVTQRTLLDLKIGDFVLFRDGSNRDVIQLFAEVLMGTECYRDTCNRATSWRTSLRSAGRTAKSVYRLLHTHGLERSYGTVCNWLYNEDLIGPQESKDLQIIEKAVGPLAYPWREIWEAIETIRSYHTSAGYKVSEWLLREVPQNLDKLVDGETRLDLDFGRFWIVEIEEVANSPDNYPLSQTNRIFWDDG